MIQSSIHFHWMTESLHWCKITGSQTTGLCDPDCSFFFSFLKIFIYLAVTGSTYGMRASVFVAVQFSSVQLLSQLCDPMDCSTPGLPVHHQLPESTQTHVHWVGDAIWPSHPLSTSSPAFNVSQHQGLFKWVISSHKVAKVMEFQLQHQSFQWIFRTDFL